MPKILPQAWIGQTDPASEQRAIRLVHNLGSPRHGRREYALLALSHLWYPRSACFYPRPPHALPTCEALLRVAEMITEEPRETTRIAAIVALRSGWESFDIMAANEKPRTRAWLRPPETTAALAAAFRDSSGLVRLQATRTLAARPSRHFTPDLQRALADPVFSVRWNAVIALAKLREGEGLVAALGRSVPRDLSAFSSYDFHKAVQAVYQLDTWTDLSPLTDPAWNQVFRTPAQPAPRRVAAVRVSRGGGRGVG